MRAKGLVLLVAAAALLLGAATAASAAEKQGKRLKSDGPAVSNSPAASDSRSNDWRSRAMKARAEFAPEDPPLRGTAHAINERGDRRDGDEVGGGRLREDRGEGGGKEE